jgi:hypothetical protein
MTACHPHQLCRSGACFMQRVQRVGAMRPVAYSVWTKNTGAGTQN